MGSKGQRAECPPNRPTPVIQHEIMPTPAAVDGSCSLILMKGGNGGKVFRGHDGDSIKED